MNRLIALLACLVAGFAHAAGPTRWDALPAVDMHHVQGPHAGRMVCPMCQHGYDAGVLVFLPADTPVVQARRIAAAVGRIAATIGDPRFRTFLVVTGSPVPPALEDALRRDEPTWHVGFLPAGAVAEASAAFGIELGRRGHGIVFAQRRLVWAFDPGAEPARWQALLASHGAYALDFLGHTYAQPVSSVDPDAPRGRLWLAPNQLASLVRLAEGPSTQVCVSDRDGAIRSDALVAIAQSDGETGARTTWARTDEAGCIRVRGFRDSGWLLAEVFSALMPVATVRVNASDLVPDGRADLILDGSRATAVTGREPVAGPCEGCEAVFEGLPAVVPAMARLAAPDQPGEPMLLSGTVFDADGNPAPGVVVYAYQTDHTGAYPPDRRLTGPAASHGRLRAWAGTDAAGRYAFRTIRPGAYPGSTEPQHVHMHVIEPGRCTYYLGDVLFAGDPRLDDGRREQQRLAPGGSGVISLEGSGRDGWRGTRDVHLGRNVSGYASCGGQP